MQESLIKFFFFFGAILILIYLIFSLNSSIEKLNNLETKKNLMEMKKREMEIEIEKIKKEIENLEKNNDIKLKIAREKLFYIRPNEKIYVFISNEGINTQTFKKKERDSKRSTRAIKN